MPRKANVGLFQLFCVTRGHSRHTNNTLTFKALNICLLDEILLMVSIILVQLKDAIAVTTLLFMLYLFYFDFIAVVICIIGIDISPAYIILIYHY